MEGRRTQSKHSSGKRRVIYHALCGGIHFQTDQSKTILNTLPIALNTDRTIADESGREIRVKSVNGSYEISGNSAAEDRTILVVNGPLFVQPGTEEIVKKYEGIIVNGNASYPKSLESCLGNMDVNGSIETYPDDCVVLDAEFTIDKYFPLRAKEGGRYYAKNMIEIRDPDVDAALLAQKGVHFETGKLLIPECKLKDCIPMFDENVPFIVVPDGLKLIRGNMILNEEFLRSEGGRLFVYGDLEVDSSADMSVICNQTEKLIVRGTVRLHAEQEEAFRSLPAAFDHLEVIRNTLRMINLPSAAIDRKVFDCAPDGIEVQGVAFLTIAEDVAPELILEKLTIRGCANVTCSEAQKSAVSAIARGVASIGTNTDCSDNLPAGIGSILGNILGSPKKFADAQKINADSYIM